MSKDAQSRPNEESPSVPLFLYRPEYITRAQFMFKVKFFFPEEINRYDALFTRNQEEAEAQFEKRFNEYLLLLKVTKTFLPRPLAVRYADSRLFQLPHKPTPAWLLDCLKCCITCEQAVLLLKKNWQEDLPTLVCRFQETYYYTNFFADLIKEAPMYLLIEEGVSINPSPIIHQIDMAQFRMWELLRLRLPFYPLGESLYSPSNFLNFHCGDIHVVAEPQDFFIAQNGAEMEIKYPFYFLRVFDLTKTVRYSEVFLAVLADSLWYILPLYKDETQNGN